SETFTLAKVGGVLLLAVTFAVAAVRRSDFQPGFKRAFDKRGMVVLILIIAGAVSTIINPNPKYFFFEQHVQFLMLFVLTRVYIDTEKRLWWALVFILLARGADGLLGIYQYLTSPTVVRIAGNFIDPNEYACYSLVALPIAVYLFENSIGIMKKLFFAALGMLTVISVIISYSRSGAITLGVMLLLFLIMGGLKFKKRLILFLIILVIFAAILPTAYWTRMETVGGLFGDEGMERSMLIRRDLLGTAIQLFLSSPLFGIGYMQFRQAPLELMGGYAVQRLRLSGHSMILQLLAEFGLAGFIPFVALLVMALVSGFKAGAAAKRAGDKPSEASYASGKPSEASYASGKRLRLLATAVTGALLSFLVMSFMLGTYSKYLYLLVALPMVASDLAFSSTSPPGPGNRAQRAMTPANGGGS
ncbi:MAG TPA: hypothetical protein ENN88_01425, partial [Candidatus Coatesbacteria bacterium]|nr:hypothetical protein [Candidatus Coatesbacteria bacterium]